MSFIDYLNASSNLTEAKGKNKQEKFINDLNKSKSFKTLVSKLEKLGITEFEAYRYRDPRNDGIRFEAYIKNEYVLPSLGEHIPGSKIKNGKLDPDAIKIFFKENTFTISNCDEMLKELELTREAIKLINDYDFDQKDFPIFSDYQ